MHMDFLRDQGLPVAMDEIDAELLRLIYTRIGATMEDASIVAIALGSSSSGFDIKERVKIDRAIKLLSALSETAQLLHE